MSTPRSPRFVSHSRSRRSRLVAPMAAALGVAGLLAAPSPAAAALDIWYIEILSSRSTR